MCIEDTYFDARLLASPWARAIYDQRDVAPLTGGPCYTTGMTIRLSPKLRLRMASLLDVF